MNLSIILTLEHMNQARNLRFAFPLSRHGPPPEIKSGKLKERKTTYFTLSDGTVDPFQHHRSQ
jgi:hypothetical protein